MEAHLHDWLSLVIRWAHFITGVAWIGASFYFNWLENHLERMHKGEGIAGDLWAVHGGGFYFLQKYQLAPPRMPETLHWFKYEAYATWLTGAALLIVVYYGNASLYMIDPAVAELSAAAAIGIGLGSMFISWFIYDGLCKSPLAKNSAVLALVVFAWFILLAWALSEYLSGRAAFIHIGAAIGTIMVANVFRVIIPAQKDMVAAVIAHRQPAANKGENALQRSRHNNYFTLPVLFIMISSHYPGTFGHPWNWLVLVGISIVGVGIRHYFNVRHLRGPKIVWLIVSLAALVLLALLSRPPTPQLPKGQATSAEVLPVIKQRCSVCHSESPTWAGIAAPPAGLSYESEANIEEAAKLIYQATVVAKTMPLGNVTGMTDEERQQIALWYLGISVKE